VPDATLGHFEELASLVAYQEFPVMPRPAWGQNAAFVGYMLDALVKRVGLLEGLLGEIVDWPAGDQTTDFSWLLRRAEELLGRGQDVAT